MNSVIIFNNGKNKVLYILLLITSFCITAGLFRFYLSGNLKGLFLVWNLFLAWIPFGIAYKINKNYTANIDTPKYKLILSLILWLLFLPNAPYIITDLIHLKSRDGIPLWYDATIFFMFAFTGLLLGILSIYFIHETLRLYLNKLTSWSLLVLIFIMSGYGIYLGRELRWNSWDIIADPIHLMMDSIQQLTNVTAISFTGMFSAVMLFTYLVFYHMIHMKQE